MKPEEKLKTWKPKAEFPLVKKIMEFLEEKPKRRVELTAKKYLNSTTVSGYKNAFGGYDEGSEWTYAMNEEEEMESDPDELRSKD